MAVTLTVELPKTNVLLSMILDQIALKLSEAFSAAAPRIKQRVGDEAAKAIKESPEYASLLSGRLRHELGVIDASPVLAAIIRNISQGVVVTSKGARRRGNNIVGGLEIKLLKGDYSEVLAVDGASFVSEHGFDVPWVKWLTLAGDTILVSDHKYVASPVSFSRTGLGLMRKPGVWRVPAEFSGTGSDNWLTRALIKLGDSITVITQEEIQRAI